MPLLTDQCGYTLHLFGCVCVSACMFVCVDFGWSTFFAAAVAAAAATKSK